MSGSTGFLKPSEDAVMGLSLGAIFTIGFFALIRFIRYNDDREKKLYMKKMQPILEKALDRYDITRPILTTLLPFEHQVAGHTKEVVVQLNGCIFKPLVKYQLFMRELALYEELQCIPEEDRFMFPKYYGAVQAQTESHGVVPYIILSNLTIGYLIPCIIDIKMGQYTYEPSVDLSKKLREKRKYIYQEEIGFRITGQKVYNAATETYVMTDKQFGRSLLPSQVLDGLAIFFCGNGSGLREDVLRIVLLKLRRILGWMASQRRYQFFCSSILIVYDGDVSVAGSIAERVEVKMIDLAHSIVTEGQLDEGYIHGLGNLIRCVELMLGHAASDEATAELLQRCQALSALPKLKDFVTTMRVTA